MKFHNFLLLGLGCNVLSFKHKVTGGFVFFDVFGSEEYRFSIALIEKGHSPLLFRGMVYFQTPGNEPITLDGAKYYIHALEAITPIYYFCITQDVSENLSLLPINNKMAAITPPWTYEIILKNCLKEIIPDNYPTLDFFKQEFFSSVGEDIEDLSKMAPLIKLCWKNKDIYNSASYLYKSIKDLGIDVCDWRESNYSPEFDTYINIGARESSFQNAFKSIEGIIGYLGPRSGREKRILRKLSELNINPTELVGFRTKEEIYSKLVKYANLRDRVSAHGSKHNKRKLEIGEVIELQAIAKYILVGRLGAK